MAFIYVKEISMDSNTEDLIVWYGDNFIKDVNPVKSILRGFRCETDMSTTTDLDLR